MDNNIPTQNNPLMERAKMPGETFTLPSQGLFYKDGELKDTVKNGEVHIHPMITMDELLFKTPDKLYSGEAIVEVFKRCIPDVVKPLDLLAKDLDFIMVCLRRVTYGDSMEITYNHFCQDDSKDQSYMVSMTPFIQNSKRVDPTNMEEAYSMKLDDLQIKLSPPRFKDVLNIYQSATNDVDDVEILQKNITDTVVGMVQSVNDVTNEEHIREWADTISAGWVRDINKRVEKVSNWGPDFITKVKCKDCGEEIEINTPINPLAFFI